MQQGEFPLRNTIAHFAIAGVDYEEAAGKWRAGDAVKSMRFFSRAIEVYDQGLHKFPSSLDLAYNKSVASQSSPLSGLSVKKLIWP